MPGDKTSLPLHGGDQGSASGQAPLRKGLGCSNQRTIRSSNAHTMEQLPTEVVWIGYPKKTMISCQSWAQLIYGAFSLDHVTYWLQVQDKKVGKSHSRELSGQQVGGIIRDKPVVVWVKLTKKQTHFGFRIIITHLLNNFSKCKFRTIKSIINLTLTISQALFKLL